jgi:hypothetical protein
MKKFNWKDLNINKVCMYYNLCDDLEAEWVLCPEHENDGLKHKPSCKVYHNSDKDVIICFGGCTNKNGKRLCLDNISLVGLLEGLDHEDKEECFEILKILEDIDKWDESEVLKGSIKIKKTTTTKKVSTTTSKVDMYKILYDCSKSIHELHLENKYFIDDYLNKRGINFDKCKDVLELNNIELRHNYYNNENSLILFDKTHKFAIKRKIDDYLKDKTYNKDDIKYQNINPVHYSKIEGSKDNIILFESFYDLLALYSHLKHPEDFTFISSNSVSNKHLICEKEKELLENAENVYLLFDNDEAGNVAALFFKTKFNNIKDIRYKLKSNKDVCEFIKNNLYIRIESEDLLSV